MKKTVLWILLAVLLFCSTGCRKKEGTEIILPQSLWMTYETDAVKAYAADARENVYTLEYEREENDAMLGSKGWFRRYDDGGKCNFSKELPEGLIGSVQAMAYCEGKVYFAAMKKGKLMLYAGDAATGELAEVTGFSEFRQMLRITAADGRLYLLGNGESFSSSAEAGKILEYTVADGQFAMLGLEGVLDAVGMRDGNLLLYREVGEEQKEYLFQLYDIQKNAVKTLAKMKDKIAVKIAEGPKEGSIVFTRTTKEMSIGYAMLSAPENVAEVYTRISPFNSCLVCVNGKLIVPNAFMNDSMAVVDLTATEPAQKEIKYLSANGGTLEPYGCGFTITRKELSPDKLVLKLLAQDTDFDMVYVNSWFAPMTGVRDSGCFYPLNDLPGVAEYLDRCFPYVKDAVTDKNGNVWMLPVKVDIPLMVCDTKRCRELGLAFGENMTYEEFFEVMAAMSAEERKQTGAAGFSRGFMTAYFYDKKSVDTAEFRRTMQVLKELSPLLNPEGNFFSQDYIFKTLDWNLSTDEKIFLYNFGSDGRVYSFPKYEKDAKNVATCRGFVINPKSDNLEQTLQYVATWVAYQMNDTREIPPFFAVPQNRTDSFLGSLYRVYENGAITMGVSEDLYAGYHDVVAGKRDLEEYIRETEKKLKIYFEE